MKKTTKRLALAMVVLTMLQVLLAIPAFAANEHATNVQDARNAVVEVRMIYTDEDNKEHVLARESGFFISTDYVLTCYHGVGLSDADAALIADQIGDDESEEYFIKNYKNRLSYKIYFNRDIELPATLTNAKSSAYDFAVLKLNNSLNGVTPLALGDDDMIDVGSKITCLGFPSVAGHWGNAGDEFKAEDVTLTTGTVGKYVDDNGTKLFMHDALIGSGSSGGPTILEDGAVVGMVNAVLIDDDRYAYSLKINDIKNVLDTFGIEYISYAGGSTSDEGCEHEWGTAVVNNCVPTYTCTKCNETKTDAAQHTYGEWVVVKEATVSAAGEKAQKCTACGDTKTEAIPQLQGGATTTAADTEKDEGMDLMTIVLIAVGAVLVVVIVIIIVIVAGGKKKAAPAPAPAQRPMGAPAPMAPPAAPMAPNAGPRPPVPPVAPMNEGAGETTVLNEGAGETTVLGGGAASCGSLIRVKTGERISITGPEFIIGKEKSRVNYCISGNNSISRAHAKIIVRGNSCYAVDMNSTNFTFVNGTKLAGGQEHLLNNGDKIKLSDEEFEFKA